ncbi:cysteine desulfurase [Candidatus Methylomirabilis sp.]|uniref:Cysteine desulfurase n=1 Tax=Candidatus Methylomirabilis tolerans TaxID=3123416 RepID=A0AAJ1AIL8_9BACT|nr:cysteine desulfurase [Candidatus Methylomirabilis sp.]
MRTAIATAAQDAHHAARPTFDVARIREDFPILRQQIRGRPLVYLDNAATSQKPKLVVETLAQYYLTENSNVHRGVHLLSERATEAFEGARAKIARFLNAGEAREIIFVRGATEGINLVAHSFAKPLLSVGDEILISEMEHHSNIVPWQIVCEETGAVLRVVPVNDDGELRLDEYERLLGPRTRLVSMVHVSNALGTINPVQQVINMAHERGVPVLIDGAQAAPHLPVDVRALDCDFYVCSGHKLFGPTGIGIVFGKARHLEAMPPYQGGGDMILSVTFEKTIYNEAPIKFEAGTPHIAGAIGLGSAIDYMSRIGLDQIAAYEDELLTYATDAISAIPGLRIIGTAKEKASILSFVLDDVHAHDIGTILDQEGIAIRTGHHCAQPVLKRFGVPATARASLAFYNTRDEIDALVKAIYKVTDLFG